MINYFNFLEKVTHFDPRACFIVQLPQNPRQNTHKQETESIVEPQLIYKFVLRILSTKT